MAGIDNVQERQRILYNPVLEYTKRLIETNNENNDLVAAPIFYSDELSAYMEYNLPEASIKVNNTILDVKDTLSLLKKKLNNVTVAIDSSEQGLKIKGYLGSDKIIFDDFDRCSKIDEEDANLVCSYFAEKSEKIEALLYGDVVSFENQLLDCEEFLGTTVLGICYEAGLDMTKDIVSATNEHIAEWTNIEILKNKAELWFEENKESNSEMEEQLVESQRIIESKKQDPSATLCKLITDRAESIKLSNDKIYDLVMNDMINIFGGELDEIVYSILSRYQDNLDDLRGTVNEIKKFINVLKSMNLMVKGMSFVKVTSMNDIILRCVKPMLKFITDQLLAVLSKVKQTMVSPIKSFLEYLDTQYEYELSSVDRLAEIAIEAIENTEAKYQDAILDFYRTTLTYEEKCGERINLCKKIKLIDEIVKVFDALERILDGANLEQLENLLTVNKQDCVKLVFSEMGWIDKYEEKQQKLLDGII